MNVALKNDGTVWTWGPNDSGLLGIGVNNTFDNTGESCAYGFPCRTTPDQVCALGNRYSAYGTTGIPINVAATSAPNDYLQGIENVFLGNGSHYGIEKMTG